MEWLLRSHLCTLNDLSDLSGALYRAAATNNPRILHSLLSRHLHAECLGLAATRSPPFTHIIRPLDEEGVIELVSGALRQSAMDAMLYLLDENERKRIALMIDSDMKSMGVTEGEEVKEVEGELEGDEQKGRLEDNVCGSKGEEGAEGDGSSPTDTKRGVPRLILVGLPNVPVPQCFTSLVDDHFKANGTVSIPSTFHALSLKLIWLFASFCFNIFTLSRH